MRETSKAHIRRMKEADAGLFPWREIFVGDGVDVGSGDDPLTKHLPNVTTFDLPRDANKLDEYFAPETFAWCHGSNVAEHLHDPHASLVRWMKIIKPGGYLCITVPEAILYGDMLWKKGPRYNDDHKATFSLFLKGSPAPKHYHVPTWVPVFEKEAGAKCLLQRLVDTKYDYSIMFTKDQTFPVDGAECFVELVFQRKL